MFEQVFDPRMKNVMKDTALKVVDIFRQAEGPQGRAHRLAL